MAITSVLSFFRWFDEGEDDKKIERELELTVIEECKYLIISRPRMSNYINSDFFIANVNFKKVGWFCNGFLSPL